MVLSSTVLCAPINVNTGTSFTGFTVRSNSSSTVKPFEVPLIVIVADPF